MSIDHLFAKTDEAATKHRLHLEAAQNSCGTEFARPVEEPLTDVQPLFRGSPRTPTPPRILIVMDDDLLSKELACAFRQAGIGVERMATLAAGSETARSGRFQVVVTAPALKDGSWKRLLAASRHCGPGFAIILVAKKLDSAEWAQALDEGALDVLDAAHDPPKAVEAARSAFWTEYLTGAWPNLELPDCSASS